MKYFIKYTLLCMAFISFSSCDLEQYVEDTFSGKRLVIISPSFLKNTVQVVFKNDQTGALLDKNMNLTVFSNKKTIDMSGNYKTEFVVKGGFLEFAIDPNENISASDPLELIIVGIDETGDYMPFYKETSTKSQGALSILFREDPSNINFEANATKKAAGIQKFIDIEDFYLTYNGERFDEEDYLGRGTLDGEWRSGVKYIEILTANRTQRFNGNYKIKIEYLKVNESEFTTISNVKIHGLGTNGEFFQLTKDHSVYWKGSGGIRTEKAPLKDFDLLSGILVPLKDLDFFYVSFNVSEEAQLALKLCEEGFNFNFSGIPNETPLSLEYATFRKDGLISAMGIANLRSDKTIVNTGSVTYSTKGNIVKFRENNQYFIEPNTQDITGAACGSTFNFRVIPKEGLVKTRLNLQFSCVGEKHASAPTVSAFMKEESSKIEADLIQFKNGVTNLYLKPGGSYNVNGKFNNTDFRFTFVNNLANIEASITQTIQDNTNIENIFFTFSKVDGQETINAVVIFKAGSCP